jgi:hypothetical protein
MFIMSPWNKTISYGETMRAEMRARESALKNFFQNVDVALREAGKDEANTSGKWQVGGISHIPLKCWPCFLENRAAACLRVLDGSGKMVHSAARGV